MCGEALDGQIYIIIIKQVVFCWGQLESGQEQLEWCTMKGLLPQSEDVLLSQ